MRFLCPHHTPYPCSVRCYASALMAYSPPSQRASQPGNQKNVENAEFRVPPILKAPHFSLGGMEGRLASAQDPPLRRGPAEVGLDPRGHS